MNITQTRIVFLFSIMPVIDSLNGLCSRLNINLSVSQIYRLILLFFIYSITKATLNKRIVLHTICFICILSICSFLHIIFNISSQIIGEFIYLLNWLYLPMLIPAIYSLCRYRFLTYKMINTILYNLSIISSLTIIIPFLLDVGYNTYGSSGAGYKGFYIANNAISFMLCILLIFAFYNLAKHITLSNIVIVILLISSCLLVGTKICLATIFISLFFILLYGIIYNFQVFIKICAIILPVCFASFILLFDKIQALLSDVFNRFEYFQNLYNNSVFDILTTGRLSKFYDLLNYFHEPPISLRYLIGQGYPLPLYDICEFDPADFFFSYGFAGIISLLLLILCVKYYLHSYSFVFRVLFLFSIVYSMFIGHVFTNTMSSTLLVLLIGVGFTIKRGYNESKAFIS